MNSLFKIICALIILSLVVYAKSQSQDAKVPDSSGGVLVSDTRSIIDNVARIFSSPAHFSEKEWIITGSIIGGTALLFTVDESARSLAQRNHSATADKAFDVGREYGRPVYGLALSGGLYLGGLAFDNSNVRVTGVMLLESLAFSGAITTVLKTVIGRSRPFLEEGNTRFRALQFEDGTTSLPSGHATVAFAVSSVLAERIQILPITVGLYSLASLTAVSRVYHDEHWVSDSFLGAAIGTVIGIAVADSHDEQHHASRLRFIPSPHSLTAELVF